MQKAWVMVYGAEKANEADKWSCVDLPLDFGLENIVRKEMGGFLQDVINSST